MELHPRTLVSTPEPNADAYQLSHPDNHHVTNIKVYLAHSTFLGKALVSSEWPQENILKITEVFAIVPDLLLIFESRHLSLKVLMSH